MNILLKERPRKVFVATAKLRYSAYSMYTYIYILHIIFSIPYAPNTLMTYKSIYPRLIPFAKAEASENSDHFLRRVSGAHGT